MLGGHGGPGTTDVPVSDEVYIPCETCLRRHRSRRWQPGYAVTLHFRACQQTPWAISHISVPYFVGVDRAEA